MRAGCFALLGTALVLPSLAGATCPLDHPDASPSLASMAPEARLLFLTEAMPRQRRNARRWFHGWATGFSVLTVGQVAAIPILDDSRQTPVLVVNAASTALGAGFLIAAPPRTVGNVRRMEALTADTTRDRCAVLADVERLMVQASSAERFGKGWLTHAGNVLVNVGAGAILGLGYDDWESAWLTTAAGVLVGEVMIWTQPMDATRDLARYRSGSWRPTQVRLQQLRVLPRLADGPGLVVSGRF